MYRIGESLIGKGSELAHIDLLIGNKESEVGRAFAESLAMPTKGHTPLLAVLEPNLQPKPSTLVVPKVTVEGMEQAELIFGPAQAAVAKAVADSLENGILPKEKAEELVIVCSVFIHPKAKDKEKIYEYNYKATKQAIERAMEKKPSAKEVLKKKELAEHPFR